jgi:hypothetical protein
MPKDTDTDVIAAAILAAGFAGAQRVALSGGVLEDTLKEKYVEFLAFIANRRPPSQLREPGPVGPGDPSARNSSISFSTASSSARAETVSLIWSNAARTSSTP